MTRKQAFERLIINKVFKPVAKKYGLLKNGKLILPKIIWKKHAGM